MAENEFIWKDNEELSEMLRAGTEDARRQFLEIILNADLTDQPVVAIAVSTLYFMQFAEVTKGVMLPVGSNLGATIRSDRFQKTFSNCIRYTPSMVKQKKIPMELLRDGDSNRIDERWVQSTLGRLPQALNYAIAERWISISKRDDIDYLQLTKAGMNCALYGDADPSGLDENSVPATKQKIQLAQLTPTSAHRQNPAAVVRHVVEKFGIKRATAYRRLQKLVEVDPMTGAKYVTLQKVIEAFRKDFDFE